MGGICSYYRFTQFSARLESNIIIMFAVAGSTTYVWLLLRRFLPASGSREVGGSSRDLSDRV
jgi:Ni/Fe-hydrogenase subunit HybB-like protein